jgi:hypothetical protein
VLVGQRDLCVVIGVDIETSLSKFKYPRPSSCISVRDASNVHVSMVKLAFSNGADVVAPGSCLTLQTSQTVAALWLPCNPLLADSAGRPDSS